MPSKCPCLPLSAWLPKIGAKKSRRVFLSVQECQTPVNIDENPLCQVCQQGVLVTLRNCKKAPPYWVCHTCTLGNSFLAVVGERIHRHFHPSQTNNPRIELQTIRANQNLTETIRD